MPIISPVESRSLKGRLLLGAIIIVLSAGAVTMVYPFAVMLSGSVRSEMDEAELNLLPEFWTDDRVLYAKFCETKYNQDIAAFNRSRSSNEYDFARIRPPVDGDLSAAARLAAWMQRPDLPSHWQVLGGIYGLKTVPENLGRLHKQLAQRFDGDLAAFTRDVGIATQSWDDIVLLVPDWASIRCDPPDDALYKQYTKLMQQRPPAERTLVSLTGAFLEKVIYPLDGQNSTAAFNRRHPEQPLARFADFRLPQTVPPIEQPVFRQEWIRFVREELNPSFVIVRGNQANAFDQLLAESYHGKLAELNRAWHSRYQRFGEIPLPDGQWLAGQQRQDYEAFLHNRPPEDLALTGPEFAWAEMQRASNPGRLRPLPPMAELEWMYVRQHAGQLRWTFTTRNYINVWNSLVTQGRALVNTFILICLSIVLALLINPLAAYALSRFRLPGTYKLLLLMMATIAFPPMVTLIPQFMVLRKLHLFNTFAALLLPVIVNGYMIFLLKGFFDSLPAELYEAARIDGAGEIRMFFGITMALSKPILAVLALSTFTTAYTMFLYPLLVAPDHRMWLISVWLYEFQQHASASAVFASVLITSIPTFILFIFLQRTIMRGIILPTEK